MVYGAWFEWSQIRGLPLTSIRVVGGRWQVLRTVRCSHGVRVLAPDGQKLPGTSSASVRGASEALRRRRIEYAWMGGAFAPAADDLARFDARGGG